MKQIPKNTYGFTLVEVMMAIVMFAFIAGGASLFAVYYFQNYSFSFEENQLIGQTQSSFTTMIREIREARMADDGAWALAQTDDNTFVFYSDVTNDGRSDRIRYFIQGTELKKGVTQPTAVPVTYPTSNEIVTTIAYNVSNAGQPLFRYFNGNHPGDTVNNPLVANQRILNTRYVEIYIRTTIPDGPTTLPFELRSGVQIRSLKDNL